MANVMDILSFVDSRIELRSVVVIVVDGWLVVLAAANWNQPRVWPCPCRYLFCRKKNDSHQSLILQGLQSKNNL